MNIEQAISAIATVIPESEKEMTRARETKNSLAVIHIFTDYINSFVEKQMDDKLFKSISLMERIHEKGDWALHNAVEQIFVYSIDLLIAKSSGHQREELVSRMPIGLYTAYINQIYRSTI